MTTVKTEFKSHPGKPGCSRVKRAEGRPASSTAFHRVCVKSRRPWRPACRARGPPGVRGAGCPGRAEENSPRVPGPSDRCRRRGARRAGLQGGCLTARTQRHVSHAHTCARRDHDALRVHLEGSGKGVQGAETHRCVTGMGWGWAPEPPLASTQ